MVIVALPLHSSPLANVFFKPLLELSVPRHLTRDCSGIADADYLRPGLLRTLGPKPPVAPSSIPSGPPSPKPRPAPVSLTPSPALAASSKQINRQFTGSNLRVKTEEKLIGL